MVSCATDHGDPLDTHDLTFARDFAKASKAIRSAGKSAPRRLRV